MAHGIDEGPHFGQILAAVGEISTGVAIDAPRTDSAQRIGNVAGIETAGEDAGNTHPLDDLVTDSPIVRFTGGTYPVWVFRVGGIEDEEIGYILIIEGGFQSSFQGGLAWFWSTIGLRL
jgi:hypothetical protein